MLQFRVIILIAVNVQLVRPTCLERNTSDPSSLFEWLGYSDVCVACLDQCEPFAKPDQQILYFPAELKSFLHEVKCENKSISTNEISEQLKNFSNILLQNITNILENQAAKNVNGLDEINNKLKELETEILDQKVAIKSFNNDLLAIKGSIKKATNCAESSLPSGVTTVYPYKQSSLKAVEVFCDQRTDGGGWTVIQNRDALPLREDFYRDWNEYVAGFGNLNGEFWLGLDNMNALTNSAQMELRVDLEDYEGVKRWAKYDSFRIGDASTKYTLTLGKYSGDAGDEMSSNNGMKFTTHDQDNGKAPGNCAQHHKGAWWYDGCSRSNLNGFQHVRETTSREGIFWYEFRGWNYSLKKASLKIRPKSSVLIEGSK